MNVDKDPRVAAALETLVPRPTDDLDALLARARADAQRLRAVRRRRRVVIALAFAALLLLAGAAIAADRLNLLPFLHSADRNAARFSIDRSHVYRGAAPAALACAGAGPGAFVCRVSGPLAPGARLYQFEMRTPAVPTLTRQGILDELDRAQRAGADPRSVDRARSDLGQVGDDFIRALNTLIAIETIGGGSSTAGPSGTERVPPPGVPAWTACTEVSLDAFRCRTLAAATGIRTDTPLYRLRPSRDWKTVHRPPQSTADGARLFEQALHRTPTSAESRFLLDLLMVNTTATGSSSSQTTKGTLIAAPSPGVAAGTAVQSLGLDTRVLSLAPLPLPRRAVPEGVPRDERRARLYRVTFRLLRGDGIDRPGVHTLFVYVTRPGRGAPWRVVSAGTKP